MNWLKAKHATDRSMPV